MQELQKKILLVDDEADILEFLSYNLKKGGYRVYTASNGDDALVLAKEKLPDLIVLDIMMPGKDGVAVCKELRNQDLFNKTRSWLAVRHFKLTICIVTKSPVFS